MTEIAFKGIFVDTDQNEIGLHNKIGFSSTDTTILRHRFFYLLSIFDEIFCENFFHDYDWMISFWCWSDEISEKRSG